jgi:hypothetical protein
VIFATVCLASAASLLPTDAEAQRRAVPRGGGTPTGSVAVPRPPSRPGYYRPYYRPYYPYYSSYYYPYFYPGFYYPLYGGFYPGFYASFAFGYGGYPYYGGYGYGPYPYYWGGYYDDRGSARIQVTPREADVFIDGYYVGKVDEFDGNLQRLHVEAGEHELAVYHDGYHPIREKVLFRRGSTLKIQYEMQPLAPGEQAPPRPTPDPNARAQERTPSGRATRPYPGDQQPPGRAYPRDQQTEFGTLSLRIQPRDAVVIVDGEEWDRPQGDDRFTIELPEGQHRLEVRKDGFRSYVRMIEVRRGQVITLNVSLTSGGAGLAIKGE